MLLISEAFRQFSADGAYQFNLPLDSLDKWVEDKVAKGGLLLDPDFQRSYVWSDEQAVSFVRYLLCGGKANRTIYFNRPSWQGGKTYGYDDFVILDGKQRLTSVLRFVRDELIVDGYKFSDFSVDATRDLIININNLKTRREVLQWYIDHNSGGTVHTEEDLAKVYELLYKEQK